MNNIMEANKVGVLIHLRKMERPQMNDRKKLNLIASSFSVLHQPDLNKNENVILLEM